MGGFGRAPNPGDPVKRTAGAACSLLRESFAPQAACVHGFLSGGLVQLHSPSGPHGIRVTVTLQRGRSLGKRAGRSPGM